jgi:4-amino-4-deoxy-L-arabinose transferase-like glycosyltransferase
MGGMETQAITAIAVAALYFYLSSSWWSLGLACGLATIARPEFVMFLLPPIGVALLLFQRHALR